MGRYVLLRDDGNGLWIPRGISAVGFGGKISKDSKKVEVRSRMRRLLIELNLRSGRLVSRRGGSGPDGGPFHFLHSTQFIR